MNARELARARRCRSLAVAAGLGLVLALFSALDRTWPSVGVGVVGAVVAVVVFLRTCRRDALGTQSGAGRDDP
ncbi:MAG: hypothetical protein ICV74_01350 [Thermoleophilia bacterium]|nr:hypothetical protein [Thermoleophilia bacterium]